MSKATSTVNAIISTYVRILFAQRKNERRETLIYYRTERVGG